MTDNEIIKALECCGNESWSSCHHCPYRENRFERHCAFELSHDALDLINRQNAEIERLMSYISDHHWDFCSIAGCEGASNDCWETCPSSIYNKVKSEAIKEFANG